MLSTADTEALYFLKDFKFYLEDVASYFLVLRYKKSWVVTNNLEFEEQIPPTLLLPASPLLSDLQFHHVNH